MRLASVARSLKGGRKAPLPAGCVHALFADDAL